MHIRVAASGNREWWPIHNNFEHSSQPMFQSQSSLSNDIRFRPEGVAAVVRESSDLWQREEAEVYFSVKHDKASLMCVCE